MRSHFLQLCVIHAVASFLHLEPRNATVLRGGEVRFNCSTDELWEVMTWLLGGRPILSISVNYGVVGRDERVFAVNHSVKSLSVWEIFLINTSFSPAAQEIVCELLPPTDHRPSSALFVQEKGSVRIVEGDVTVDAGTLLTFHCEAVGWYPEPRVSWVFHGSSVDRDDHNTSSFQDGSGLFNSSSELQVTAESSSTLECWVSVSADQSLQTSAVNLTVVTQKATREDYTVVIAVCVSVCIIVLLAVLILILFYRKKHTKPSSENNVSSFSSWAVILNSGRWSFSDETSGKVNPGYHPEDITSSGHDDLRSRADSSISISSPARVPDIVIFSSQNPKEDLPNLYGKGAKTVRRVTTV